MTWGEATGVKPDNGALPRAIVYSLALLYLFLDLFFFQGFLYKKVRGADPSSKEAIAGETARGVAARVFYQPILLTQIDRRVQERNWREGKTVAGLSGEELEARRLAALNGLFEEHLLRVKVRFNPEEVSVTEEEVARAVRKFKKKFPSEALENGAISNQGWQGEKELVARVRAKLEQESYLARYIPVAVSEEELTEYYETHRERLALPERIRVRHIFFPALDHPAGEARRLAENSLRALQRGGDFALLAKELSQDLNSKNRGGDLGWMARDRLSFDFADQVFALPTGEARVVETLLGAHVVEVVERAPAREWTLQEIRPELEVALSNLRREEGLQRYLRVLRHRDRYKTEVFREMMTRPWSLTSASSDKP